jgi:hypothetical protein
MGSAPRGEEAAAAERELEGAGGAQDQEERSSWGRRSEGEGFLECGLDLDEVAIAVVFFFSPGECVGILAARGHEERLSPFD